jgi:hypothetical protein
MSGLSRSLNEEQVRTIDLLPNGRPGTASDRLYGTVRTRGAAFTGFIQWNRVNGSGSDELNGNTADGELSLRFDTVRSIARKSSDSSLVTLVGGKEIVPGADFMGCLRARRLQPRRNWSLLR